MSGLVHIYTGDGKGKTTAALGLALRNAGSGNRVLILQFMKGRDTGELHALARIPNIEVLRLDQDYGFYKQMTQEEKQTVRQQHDRLLQVAAQGLQEKSYGLIVFDEAISAYRHELLNREKLLELISVPSETERVLTGRNAPEALLQKTDYITEMQAVRHPMNQGIPARKGVEF